MAWSLAPGLSPNIAPSPGDQLIGSPKDGRPSSPPRITIIHQWGFPLSLSIWSSLQLGLQRGFQVEEVKMESVSIGAIMGT